MEKLVVKRTGTYADALEAIGLASLLSELGFSGVTILDEGPHFKIRSQSDVAPEQWPNAISLGYWYIWEKSKEQKPDQPKVIDYEAEKEKRDKQRKLSRKVKNALEPLDIESSGAPVPELATAAILSSMRKGWNGDRELAKWIVAHPQETSAWVRSNLQLGEGMNSEVPKLSNSQVLNPISGKGVHAGKTELRSSGSIPTHLISPFSEWMKLRGLWRAMLLYRVDDDFKFFVLEPSDMPADEIEAIKTELQSRNLWGGIRLDIAASLYCADVLIRRSDAMANGTSGLKLLNRRPRSIIAGLRQSYFKSLGTAAALMNDAFLPLPAWFVIEDRADAEIYLEIIEEAIGKDGKGGCLNSLQEKNSDDGRILQQYREWLLSGELANLLEFHLRFGVHVLSRLGAKEWAKPFNTENLNNLLIKSYEGEYRVREIIENQGFQSVARAVRNATVYALTIPSLGREVRFGLAQRWKQKIKGGENEFVAAVAAFVQDYNWETANRLEGKGHTVTTDDLDALLDVVQTRGVELVGSLLLAYGFARAPKVDPSQTERTAA